jgi:carboxylesterase type B
MGVDHEAEHFIAVDFTNVRTTKGDLFPLVDQCRRAVGWTYRNAAKFGGDPERLYLCSRSSGSHLAGCVVTTDWETMGLLPSKVRRSLNKFGFDLALARKKRSLTTRMMAERLGVAKSTYPRSEKGDPHGLDGRLRHGAVRPRFRRCFQRAR